MKYKTLIQIFTNLDNFHSYMNYLAISDIRKRLDLQKGNFMTVYELQELLEDKNQTMKVVIATYDEKGNQKLFDLIGEDTNIRGGAPTFYFLKAIKS